MRKIVLILSFAYLLIFPLLVAESKGVSVKNMIGISSEFRQHAERIIKIRGGISPENGIYLLSSPLKIGEDDFLLMGADNSSAKRNHPEIPTQQREVGGWFAGDSDLKASHFSNMSGTVNKDGTETVDSFYTTLPKPEYRTSPEEVAWHYVRVRELRAQQIPVEQRIATMNAEAKNKPWEHIK